MFSKLKNTRLKKQSAFIMSRMQSQINVTLITLSFIFFIITSYTFLAASPLTTLSSHDSNNESNETHLNNDTSVMTTTKLFILTYPYNTKHFNNTNNNTNNNKETHSEMETFFHKYKHYLLNLENLNQTIFPSASSLPTSASLLTTSTSQIMSMNTTSSISTTTTTTTSSRLLDLKNFKETFVYKGRNYTLFNVTIDNRQQRPQSNDNNDQFNPLLSIGEKNRSFFNFF
jgi:hypothetical protein